MSAERIAEGRAFLAKYEARDAELERVALEASREGDGENVWYATALRALVRRFIAKLRADIALLEAATTGSAARSPEVSPTPYAEPNPTGAPRR